jgi:calcium/proton exchanger (cax)
LWDQH